MAPSVAHLHAWATHNSPPTSKKNRVSHSHNCVFLSASNTDTCIRAQAPPAFRRLFMPSCLCNESFFFVVFVWHNLPKQEREQMQEHCCCGGMFCVPSQWVRGAARVKCLSPATRRWLWFVSAAVWAAKTNKCASCAAAGLTCSQGRQKTIRSLCVHNGGVYRRYEWNTTGRT